MSAESKIAIIGQAPGRKVHHTGISWNDQSGEKLREWLDVSKEEFYDEKLFAILPMAFCFPGKGKTGDLPPRKECAPFWHQRMFDLMPNIELILLIGTYAQKYYLKKGMKGNLTETVKSFEEYLPEYFPLVHPSPLNFRWQKNNPWFDLNIVPILQLTVANILKK